MHEFKCNTLSSLQINNGTFHFECREENEHITCQGKKESKYNKKEKRVDGNNKVIHQVLIICFTGRKERKKKDRKKDK